MRGLPALRAGRRRLGRLILPPRSPDVLELPAEDATAEHRDRGSRFIAVVCTARSAEEARALRERERRRFHDASHHVLAARLEDGSEIFDDDGEPSGTGGRPVLEAIRGSGLSNAAVVVTRYFGGIKLGTGGLARAYAKAAADALAASGRRRFVRGTRLELRFRYEDTGAVMRALTRAGAVRLAERFSDRVELVVGVPRASARGLEAALEDSTAGRIRIREGDEPVLLPG